MRISVVVKGGNRVNVVYNVSPLDNPAPRIYVMSIERDDTVNDDSSIVAVASIR